MIRNPYGHSSKNPRRLHFPVPEDIFASEDQVAERHERDIRSPAIDQAIDDWNLAKEAGDEHGLRTAATAIVNATSAAFKLQGVPTFAHPVLPPQFVKAEAPGFAHVSKGQRNALVTELLDKFDPSVKPSGLQQFAQRLIGRLPRDARSDGEINSEEPSPFVTAQAQRRGRVIRRVSSNLILINVLINLRGYLGSRLAPGSRSRQGHRSGGSNRCCPLSQTIPLCGRARATTWWHQQTD